MVENALAIAQQPRRTRHGVNLNAAAVQDTINKLNRINVNQPKDFLQTEIERMENLQKVVINKEKDLFKLLHLEGSNHAAQLRTLQQRIDTIDSMGLNELIPPQVYIHLSKLSPYFRAISQQTLKSKIQSDEFSKLITQYAIKEQIFDAAVTNYTKKELELILTQTLNKALSAYKDTSSFAYFDVSYQPGGQVAPGKKIGLKRYLSVDLKDHNFKLTLADRIPSNFKNRLFLAVQQIERPTDSSLSTSFTISPMNIIPAMKTTLFNSILPKLNGLAKTYFITEWDKLKSDDYAFNRNESVIQGVLGEMRTNILFRILLGKNTNVIPAGNRKDIEHQQSIAIDTVLQILGKNFGLQVKSYTLTELLSTDKATVSFEFEHSAANLINQRGQMSYADLLTELFGSYQFNQPFESVGGDWYRTNIYNQFQNTYPAIEKILLGSVDNIMAISKKFGVQNKNGSMFLPDELHYNTIFMINNSAVPSSAILEAIIQSLKIQQQKQVSDIVDIEFKSMHAKSEGNTLGKLNQRRTDRSLGLNALDLSKEVQTKYKISFELQKILTMAGSYIHKI